MSSQNYQSSSWDSPGPIAIIGMGVLVYVVFAVAAFLAIFLTVLSIYAWNEPLQLTDDVILEPEEAQAFIVGGVAGAIILPLFVAFTAFLYGFSINWSDVFMLLLVAGYVIGSFGLVVLIEGPPQPVPATYNEEIEIISQPKLKAHRALPFTFASWDDEEGEK